MKIKGIMGPVKDVTAPDPSTVQVSFSAPVPYITDILDYWFLIRIDDKTDPQFVKKLPVGTGPFKMAEWVPQQYARFTKNADYWNKDLPNLDEFLFKRLSQAETLLPNLKSGALDGVLLTSFSDVAPLQADTNYAVDVNDNAGSIFNMMVNTSQTAARQERGAPGALVLAEPRRPGQDRLLRRVEADHDDLLQPGLARLPRGPGDGPRVRSRPRRASCSTTPA